ncbi:MAG: nodulation protein NfeD, partial [Acidobacteria bacterium]|nr:nodulation protein NfeD [Acidobacteriota bacterium]
MRFIRFAVIFAFLFPVSIVCQRVYKIELDAAIHQITEEYVVEAIQTANKNNADLILLVIDTPGGYIKNVEKIQRAILESKIPVVAFVYPSGARAASGGVFVAVASDFIAMAPGTTIGSAHPVSGLPIPISPTNPQNPSEKQKSSDSVMLDKIVNDLNAHLRSISEIRGRNPEPIQQMVKESISLTEKEALEQRVIELVAKDEQELFEHLKGTTLKRFDGSETKLPSHFSEPQLIKMTFRQKVLSSIASPEIAFVLLLLGVLGLFVEFKSPGLIFPGVIGGIAILLYMLSLPLLPVNAVGILLVLLGIVFFILEIKVVSYGILGIGGTIALIIGSLMLYKGNPLTGEGLHISFVLPIVLGFVAILSFLIYLAIKAFKNPIQAGAETL